VQPENGAKIKVFGEISVYEARGSVQLIVRKVEPIGEGELQAKFDHLKNKLKSEGLFDDDNKLPIPKFPKKIGLITSGTGAALQDMLNVLERRAPWIQPILYAVPVQGVGAENKIAAAINHWSNWDENEMPEVDVLIIGRGGGSLEDLWNFNEEVVARAIYDCEIPIISAVGHEIDFTIADFVADMRAPTPSAAAELAAPDKDTLIQRLDRISSMMSRLVQTTVERHELVIHGMSRGVLSRSPDKIVREPLQRLILARRDLDDAIRSSVNNKVNDLQELNYRLSAQKPEAVIGRRLDKLDHLSQRLTSIALEKVNQQENRLNKLTSMLRTLGPESVFARGFSVTQDEEGNIIKDAKQLNTGDSITTRFHKGKVASKVV